MAVTVLTTFSGRKVDYLNPRNISLADLALGLSRMPRYAGQTTRRYSVAQHCLFVAELVSRDKEYALIHDAQEAFLCDIPTPAKVAMRILAGDRTSQYDQLEFTLYVAICRRVGLNPDHNTASIGLADRKARIYEMRMLHPGFEQGKPHPALERILDYHSGGRQEWLDAATAIRRAQRKAA